MSYSPPRFVLLGVCIKAELLLMTAGFIAKLGLEVILLAGY